MAPVPEALKYPVGRFTPPEDYNAELLESYRSVLARFPGKLARAVEALSIEQLETPYRPEGWTVRQVVHHCADSHMNAFIRFKLTLTEDGVTIRPYAQDSWAGLPDAQAAPVELSLNLLSGLHARWSLLLAGMDATQFKRAYYHPESQKYFTLQHALALYAWHCRHHLAHITRLFGE